MYLTDNEFASLIFNEFPNLSDEDLGYDESIDEYDYDRLNEYAEELGYYWAGQGWTESFQNGTASSDQNNKGQSNEDDSLDGWDIVWNEDENGGDDWDGDFASDFYDDED